MTNRLFVSFDMVSLFTKIPIDDFLRSLSVNLTHNDLPIPLHSFVNLIKCCLTFVSLLKNYFINRFWSKYGIFFDSCCCSLYMEFFESRLVSSLNNFNFVLWVRYVDDILTVWDDDISLSHMVAELSTLIPSIQFRHELEVVGRISFFNFKIIKGTYPSFNV